MVILSPPAIPLIGDLLSHTLSPLLSRLMLPRSFRSRNDRKGLGTTDNGTIGALKGIQATNHVGRTVVLGSDIGVQIAENQAATQKAVAAIRSIAKTIMDVNEITVERIFDAVVKTLASRK